MSDIRTVRRDEVIAKARRAIAAGLVQTGAVLFLRQGGLNKIDSMLALCNLYGTDLDEAKRMVHESTAWQDCKSADERLHEDLIVAVDQLSGKQQRIAG